MRILLENLANINVAAQQRRRGIHIKVFWCDHKQLFEFNHTPFALGLGHKGAGALQFGNGNITKPEGPLVIPVYSIFCVGSIN